MQSPVPISDVLRDIATSLVRGGGVSSPTPSGMSGWFVALASLLTLLAAGTAVRTARRLARRSAPELLVLLDQSAAFYGRWPEDRLTRAPRAELLTEAARCRRIIELLELRPPDGGGATRGAVDGLRAWIALLTKRIDGFADVPSGPAYA